MASSSFKLSFVLLFVSLLPLATKAQIQKGNCISKHTKFNVCESALELQNELAPTLPQKLSSEMILDQVFVVGPEITLQAIWLMSDQKLSERLKLNGMSIEQLSDAMVLSTTKTVCSLDKLSAFVRLGGQVGYIYKTEDGTIINHSIVSECS